MNNYPEYTIIPAQPGWILLTTFCGDDGKIEGLHESPIIAWRVETTKQVSRYELDSLALPITEEFESLDSFGSPYAILRPNGDICFPEEKTVHNLADALEYFRHWEEWKRTNKK